MNPKDQVEENARITRRIAEELGLDPSMIKDGFEAEWAGGDASIVITWTGIKSLSLTEWSEILNQVLIREGEANA